MKALATKRLKIKQVKIPGWTLEPKFFLYCVRHPLVKHHAKQVGWTEALVYQTKLIANS